MNHTLHLLLEGFQLGLADTTFAGFCYDLAVFVDFLVAGAHSSHIVLDVVDCCFELFVFLGCVLLFALNHTDLGFQLFNYSVRLRLLLLDFVCNGWIYSNDLLGLCRGVTSARVL